jgi:hypothetical protein
MSSETRFNKYSILNYNYQIIKYAKTNTFLGLLIASAEK